MSKRARDAEEFRRKKLARTRFRTLIRSVVLNRIWLVDPGEQKLSLNAKKNIALLVRTQHKVGLLTLAEKSLIKKHHLLRSPEERKSLVSLLATLTCFSPLPPKVRARLAPCVKFLIITPGRTLIKEGNDPLMVYFLLTGEVEVSKKVYDHATGNMIESLEMICGPGDCLGYVEMLERCKRQHTYISTNMVELLVVLDDDFDRVLRPVMEHQWMEKKSAILALDYFSFFSSEQVISTSKLCILRQFEPLETIYYEDKGKLSYVYFVLSGECMILQSLEIMIRGKAKPKLVEIPKQRTENRFRDISNIELLKLLRKEGNASRSFVKNSEDNIEDPDHENQRKSVEISSTVDMKSIEILCGFRKASVLHPQESETSTNFPLEEEEASGGQNSDTGIDEAEQKIFESIEQDQSVEGLNVNDGIPPKASQKPAEKERPSLTTKNTNATTENASSPPPRATRHRFEKTEQTTYESHFIDVGSLAFGAIFGLGEKMDHRVIMARTTVHCLMIPRFWLFEKDQNPSNIWQRRRFYLDTTIPSRELLFRDFISTHNWQRFKHKVVQSNLNPNSISNYTKVQDVPIICRIVEATDD